MERRTKTVRRSKLRLAMGYAEGELELKFILILIYFLFFILYKMEKEEIKEQNPQTRRGRPRKYATDQERINAISKKQCAEKRQMTKIKHDLRDGKHDSQFYLLNLLSSEILDDKIMDSLKNLLNVYLNKTSNV